ncbi:hypothetical protein B0H34DRAFT_263935 [Crassisporium funariophilum]|nr:hypothetical protein B0H34DRAFT_263935 [Crassisporium funariophilum]
MWKKVEKLHGICGCLTKASRPMSSLPSFPSAFPLRWLTPGWHPRQCPDFRRITPTTQFKILQSGACSGKAFVPGFCEMPSRVNGCKSNLKLLEPNQRLWYQDLQNPDRQNQSRLCCHQKTVNPERHRGQVIPCLFSHRVGTFLINSFIVIALLNPTRSFSCGRDRGDCSSRLSCCAFDTRTWKNDSR